MYDHPFFITGNRSNNAFSFEKRSNPTLYVPSLIEGDLDDVKIGDQVVFEDFDSSYEGATTTSRLRGCVGLRHFVKMSHPKTGKSIVIVDNHNHVFYFWHEALSKGQIRKGATLIHIDQHKDMRKPEKGLDEMSVNEGATTSSRLHSLPDIFEYTNSVLNVGSYIPPAIESGLISRVISITSEKELRGWDPNEGAQTFARLHLDPSVHPSLILNLDLDFWAPEMDYIDGKLKNRVARSLMHKADLITIATSPFFIEQERAIEVLRELLE